MSRLSISLLGGFEAALDGQPLTTFGTDKVRGLFSFWPSKLVTLIAARLWPACSGPRWRKNAPRKT